MHVLYVWSFLFCSPTNISNAFCLFKRELKAKEWKSEQKVQLYKLIIVLSSVLFWILTNVVGADESFKNETITGFSNLWIKRWLQQLVQMTTPPDEYAIFGTASHASPMSYNTRGQPVEIALWQCNQILWIHKRRLVKIALISKDTHWLILLAHIKFIDSKQ